MIHICISTIIIYLTFLDSRVTQTANNPINTSSQVRITCQSWENRWWQTYIVWWVTRGEEREGEGGRNNYDITLLQDCRWLSFVEIIVEDNTTSYDPFPPRNEIDAHLRASSLC